MSLRGQVRVSRGQVPSGGSCLSQLLETACLPQRVAPPPASELFVLTSASVGPTPAVDLLASFLEGRSCLRLGPAWVIQGNVPIETCLRHTSQCPLSRKET